MESLDLTFEFNSNDRLSFLALFYFERPMLHIGLDNRVIEFSSYKPLSIEDSVVWIFGCLVFGCVSDKSFSVSEANIWWSSSVSLIVGYDLDLVILPHSDTGVCCSEIDSDCFWCVAHFCFENNYRSGGEIFKEGNCSSIF